jgi:hypothetical protein
MRKYKQAAEFVVAAFEYPIRFLRFVSQILQFPIEGCIFRRLPILTREKKESAVNFDL